METYRIIGVGADGGVGDRAVPAFRYGRVFVGGATSVGRIVDGFGNAVDESDHSVFPVPDMVAVPQTEDT